MWEESVESRGRVREEGMEIISHDMRDDEAIRRHMHQVVPIINNVPHYGTPFHTISYHSTH